MQTLLNLIDGRLVEPSSGKYLDNTDPATGTVYSRVPASEAADAQKAIAAAKKAFPSWSQTSGRERAQVLRKLSELILRNLDELARAESIDSGKPLSAARSIDIPRSAYNFEFFADAATQFSSESHLTHASLLNYTLRTGLGVVSCVSPWNLPLYLLTWKIAPALASGCTVVAKPSEITPMTAFLLSRLVLEAGLPPGVLNIVHGLGPDLGPTLCTHPDIKAISFTGSTKTGSQIAQQASPLFKKLSLEMGGKNPTLVFEDADLEQAVEGALGSAFSNQGQICLCGSRIYVDKRIYSEFKTRLISRVRELKLVDPLESSDHRRLDQGALVSQAHFEKVLKAIETARKEGGTVLTGGHAVQGPGRCKSGYFIEPTIIEGLGTGCKTIQEEIFGPVATLSGFETESEAIALANSTGYGLAASIWTENISRAQRVSHALESGIVWINCWMQRDLRTPFGGVKNSGLGREGGLEAMRFFTEPKNVCIQWSELK